MLFCNKHCSVHRQHCVVTIPSIVSITLYLTLAQPITPAVPSPDDYERIGVTYPNFMAPQWFKKANAGALRQHIRHLLLTLFLEQSPEQAPKPPTLLAMTAPTPPLSLENRVEPESSAPCPALDPGSGSAVVESVDPGSGAGVLGKEAAGSADPEQAGPSGAVVVMASQVDVTNVASQVSGGKGDRSEALEALNSEINTYESSSSNRWALLTFGFEMTAGDNMPRIRNWWLSLSRGQTTSSVVKPG